MTRITIPVLALLLSSQAVADDRWDTRDKRLHAGVSTLISTAVYAETRSYGAAFAGCMGVGIAKEVVDEARGGPFSWKDLGADAVGCGTGLVLGRLLFGTNNGLTYRF